MLKKIALAVLLLPSLAAASPYIVAGGASGTADLSAAEEFYGPSHSTDDEYGRALIGIGAEINPNLGIEALYMTEAEVTVQDSIQEDVFTHSGFQFALLGKAPLTPQLSLFGKLSANYMTVEDEYTAPGFTVSDEDSKFQLGYGVGLHFQASDAVGLRLAMERIELDDYTLNGVSADSELDQASLAFTFAF